MGQEEVMNVLKKAKEPMSVKQIADALKIDAPIKVSKIIRKMLRFGEIKCIELNRFQAGKRFGWKKPVRRVRVYYV